MDTATAGALQTAASQLHASARSHKRAAEHHRRQAREQMAELDRLRALCAAHGITLHIQAEGKGATGNGRAVQSEDARRA